MRQVIIALENTTYDLVTSLLILMAATAEGRLQVIAFDEETDFLLSWPLIAVVIGLEGRVEFGFAVIFPIFKTWQTK